MTQGVQGCAGVKQRFYRKALSREAPTNPCTPMHTPRPAPRPVPHPVQQVRKVFTMTSHDGTPGDSFTSFTVDPHQSVDLEDVGGGDYRLSVALSPVGVPTYILYSPAECQRLKSISIPETPRHELRGPLPPNYQKRIEVIVGHRCGHPTGTGRLCRTRVQAAGQACRRHREP